MAHRLGLVLLLVLMHAGTASGQNTAFTYQGQLTDGAAPANGTYDLQFKLFDAAMNGAQKGSTATKDNVSVANGVFTVQLDFGGGIFDGSARWLELGVRPGVSTGAFQLLTPRQALNGAPYALFSAAPWVTNGSNISFSNGNVGIGTANPLTRLHMVSGASDTASRLESSGTTGFAAGLDFYQGAVGKGYVGAPDSAASLAPGEMMLFGAAGTKTSLWAGGNRSVTIDTNGNVGIGTANPLTRLHMVSGASDTASRLESSGTTGFAAGLDFYQGAVGKGYVGAPDSAASLAPGEMMVLGGAGTKTSLWAGGNRSVTIETDGDVGIGTATPNERLTVKASGSSGLTAFSVRDSNDSAKFSVTDSGFVFVSNVVPGPSTGHVCRQQGYLSDCSSAAEYVPTVASDLGYPEAGDLVSIAGVNPYGDEHAPFAVGKSTQACDQNLVGFLLEPELGADGIKLNDHYLPLAIYGYFPAKVTRENGPIKRGDPITSSSTPGYGMKATSACKIIGYALEDADRDGTIQVFADHGEHAAPEVAALRAQVQELRQANAVLAARLETVVEPHAELEARLTALEQALHRQPEVRQANLSSLPGD